jgi:hypothetical protein
MELPDFLTAGGVLLGFQVTSFGWRISEEARVARQGDITWLPPADFLNLVAMIVTVSGVFVLPALGINDSSTIKIMFGLGAILFVGHSISMAGHYELFNNKTKRSFAYFPFQEKVAVTATSIVALLYLVAAMR